MVKGGRGENYRVREHSADSNREKRAKLVNKREALERLRKVFITRSVSTAKAQQIPKKGGKLNKLVERVGRIG